MNEQVRNILEQSTTKTSKIEQLLRLGLTRREIADLVTRGNYGFVYNVEKKMLEREGGVLAEQNCICPDGLYLHPQVRH